MTASESPRIDEDESAFDADSLVWPDAGTARRLWHSRGHVEAILGQQELPALPPALPEEARGARDHADPEGYLLRRRAVRALAAAVLDQAPEDFRITRSTAGAPCLAGTDLRISFSGRAPYSAILIARKPAGIDLEGLIRSDAIPWKVLREDESRLLKALPPAQQGEAFIRLWSAKEAYAKALGLGFLLPPECLQVEPGGKASFLPAPGQEPLPGGMIRTTGWRAGPGKTVIISLALLSS
ncbi:MAG: 4'-phosphopantetheinyl transferase superfamily protein [Beijerinckiaceae bacterium]|nr:4'-phosphopantetheinyl transferase superfamily protein [Beijerinckiaceae bacterium]